MKLKKIMSKLILQIKRKREKQNGNEWCKQVRFVIFPSMCVEFDPKIGIFRLILYQIISFSQKKIHDELKALFFLGQTVDMMNLREFIGNYMHVD